MKVRIEQIGIGDRLRQLNPDTVSALKASIAEIGLRTPISVRDPGSEEEPWELARSMHEGWRV